VDHTYITEHDLVSRYVLGKLAPEESARFEEHFIDCPECLDRIEMTSELRSGLRSLPRREIVGARPQSAGARWLGVLRDWRLLVFSAAATLLLVVTSVQWVSTRAQLAREQRETREWRARYEHERKSRQAAEQLVATSMAPAAVYRLTMVRSGPDAASAPVSMTFPAAATGVVLLLELGPAPEFRGFRAVLQRAGGETLWLTDNLRQDAAGEVAVTLRPGVLEPGAYVINLEGWTTDSRYAHAARYAFRVERPKSP
jgi:hypothetical protein